MLRLDDLQAEIALVEQQIAASRRGSSGSPPSTPVSVGSDRGGTPAES